MSEADAEALGSRSAFDAVFKLHSRRIGTPTDGKSGSVDRTD
ncbi:hypothetical protein [Stieleria sedimenti]|nr:hypothetical protein [Stieleria sedimenti]